MKICNNCRSCATPLESILNLGEHFISDFPDPKVVTTRSKVPLELMLCPACSLLQLHHSVDPDEMYRHYWYHSGTNQTMRLALADIAHKAEALVHLKSGDTILDVGCNDGTLLSSYRTQGILKVGIDPSNVAASYCKSADTLVVDFFSANVYKKAVPKNKPKIVTSIAMFYDLDDPNSFVSDMKQIIDKDGLWIIQMSYLPLMLKTNEFGNICHEHLEYYSLKSLEHLLHRHEFEIVDVELNPINGGSLRAYIRNKGAAVEKFGDGTYRVLAQDRVRTMRAGEEQLGLSKKQVYTEFAMRVERIKEDTVRFIGEAISRKKTVYVYGASTKGNTVLQYFGLDSTTISAAAERNQEKWGRVTVGTNIPIISEDIARKAHPDYFLILPWHFLEEFMAREHDYLYSGGRFIVPFPYFTLV